MINGFVQVFGQSALLSCVGGPFVASLSLSRPGEARQAETCYGSPILHLLVLLVRGTLCIFGEFTVKIPV